MTAQACEGNDKLSSNIEVYDNVGYKNNGRSFLFLTSLFFVFKTSVSAFYGSVVEKEVMHSKSVSDRDKNSMIPFFFELTYTYAALFILIRFLVFFITFCG